MAQIPTPRCDCCGQQVNPAEDDYCTHCQYPVNPDKEERFLVESLRNLRRVAMYGGAQMSVTDLIRRYEARLHYLGSLKDASMAVSKSEAGRQDVREERPTGETSTPLPVPQPAALMLSLQKLPEGPIPSQESTPPVATMPAQRSPRVSFLSALSGDALVNIVASLGGFFVLVGALGFITTTSNLLLAFLIVFLVHAVFGAAGLIAHRFPSFRIVSGTYTIIFALLVPLVGFSAYRLVTDNLVALSIPTLIALAALYAAVIYTMLALVQKFVPFAYLGLLALLVTDLAVVRAFQWGYWWWPVAAMILAFPALSAIVPPSGNTRPFAGSRSILQTPTRVLMYSIVTASWISGLVILLDSLLDDALNAPQPAARLSLFILALLLSGWTALLIWQTKHVQRIPVLACLLPICVLSGAYVLHLEAVGYVLALTGIALLYVGINHTTERLLVMLAPLSLKLDQIALVITALVPFISSPFLLLDLLSRAFSPQLFPASWQAIVELVAIALCLAITLDITFRRAGLSKIPAKSDWCWLLVYSGFLLVWEYSQIVLLLNFEPVWAFVGLTLVLIGVAVIVRRLIGAVRANPLDLLAAVVLGGTLILSLHQNLDTISALLLVFAAILYGVLLYQRRSAWLFLPFGLALLALPAIAEHHPPTMLLIGLLLPLAAVRVRRFVSKPEHILPTPRSIRQLMTDAFEWPLLAIGLLSGIISLTHDLSTNTSAIATIPGLHFSIALQIVLLVYAIVVFAVAVFEQQPQDNWLAAWGTILTMKLTAPYMLGICIGAAVAGLLSGRIVHVKLATTQANAGTGTVQILHRFTWSWPWYGTALLAAILTGCWPTLTVNQPGAAFIPYSLLAFTVVATVVMFVEQTPELMLIPTAFLAWTIWLWQPPFAPVASMVAYSLLCILIFASQFTWLLVPPMSGRLSPTKLCNGLALGGQLCVVLAIIGQGGLSPDAGSLVSVGAGALLELALLLFLSGITHFGIVHHRNATRSTIGDLYEQVRADRMQRARLVLHRCNYGAGLLFSLAVSWELIALHQTHFDVLTLAPASYLIVIAPFLMRDQILPEQRTSGQIAALVGAALLLLPALWFSFSDTNLVPTLILVGESLLLLLLGMMTRLRIFILSSAALIVIGTLRILFLAIPPSLPLLLMAFGAVLVVVATALIRARRRLLAAWTRWE